MTPETQKLVRSNLGAYFLKQNPSYEWVSFQQEYIIPALHKVASHEIRALMIWMPPRHAKTDLALINFTAWLFGRYPKRSNMGVSYSDKYAKRFGRKILNLVQSDVQLEAFPEPGCRVSPSARSGSYFALVGGGQFFSAGFGGTITGQGVDGVLAIDDPIKNMEEARSEAVMRSRMEDYRSSAKTRLEGGSRLLTTTRWSKHDFAQRVLDEDGYAEEGGDWTVLSFPAEAGVDDPLDREPGEFLWSDNPKFGVQHYMSAKRNTRVWNALFQQAPDSEKGKFFKYEWLTWYEQTVKPGRFHTYMIVDPARGKSEGHDRTCILVFASTPEKRLLLVDGVLARLDPGERAAEMVRLHRKWRPLRTVYEEYGLVNDTWYLEQEYRKLGIRAYPIAVGRKGARHQLSKETRIEGLIPDFREGRIVLPRSDRIPFPAVQRFDRMDDERMSIIDYFVANEYLEYAGEDSVEHDDVLDAMTRLHDPELSISFPRSSAQDVARSTERNRPRAGSWEAIL